MAGILGARSKLIYCSTTRCQKKTGVDQDSSFSLFFLVSVCCFHGIFQSLLEFRLLFIHVLNFVFLYFLSDGGIIHKKLDQSLLTKCDHVGHEIVKAKARRVGIKYKHEHNRHDVAEIFHWACGRS